MTAKLLVHARRVDVTAYTQRVLEPPICVLRGAEWIGIPSVQNWLI
jgi:hypothetical protein